MQGPQRAVIVNEDDTRKLGVYTEGDTEAAIDGVAILAEGPGNALTPIKVNANGEMGTIDGLSIPEHDYIGMAYTGSNLTTVTYKTGGSGGTTVATLTLAYDGSDNLTSVTKS